MIFRFLECSLDTDTLRLTLGGTETSVEPQVFSLIQFLIENRERVVSKDEIIDQVWGGRIVSDGALNSRINAARRALGDDGKAQAVIKTFPRRGFKFVPKLDNGDDISPDSPASSLTVADKPSIAVLPFDNLSGDPAQEYFSDGITEDIITALSRVRQFLVIARSSTFSYKGAAVDVQTVAKELGVRYVLEGSVRKIGDRVRINVQLIDGETGNHLWAEKYDRDLEDIFILQDEITFTVIGAIEPELSRAERERAKAKTSDSLDAWDLVLRGWAILWDSDTHGRAEEFRKAQRLFEQSIEIDPRQSRAYSGLTMCAALTLMLGFAEDRASTIETALAAGRTAARLDSEDPTASMSLGILYVASTQPDLAILELERALTLNPSSSWSHFVLGMANISKGRFDAGISLLSKAIDLSPRADFIGPAMVWIGQAHFQKNEFDQALAWSEKALREPATQIWGNIVQAAALTQLGRVTEAEAAIAELRQRRPGISLKEIERTFYLQDTSQLDRLLDGLDKAGLPKT